MSKKDFDLYYKELCDQYMQLNSELEVLQKEAAEHSIEPEKIEILKKSFKPILDSYQMISWVAFLLNKPAKKNKRNRYDKMLSAKTSKLDLEFKKEEMIKRNNNVLDNVHKNIKEL